MANIFDSPTTDVAQNSGATKTPSTFSAPAINFAPQKNQSTANSTPALSSNIFDAPLPAAPTKLNFEPGNLFGAPSIEGGAATSPAGIAYNTIVGLPKATETVVKNIGQGIAREAVGTGMGIGNIFNEAEGKPIVTDYTPSSSIGKEILGTDKNGPVNDIATQYAKTEIAAENNPVAKALGFNNKTAQIGNTKFNPLLLGGFAGMTALDFTPFGGGEAQVDEKLANQIPDEFLKFVSKTDDEAALRATYASIGVKDPALAEKLAAETAPLTNKNKIRQAIMDTVNSHVESKILPPAGETQGVSQALQPMAEKAKDIPKDQFIEQFNRGLTGQNSTTRETAQNVLKLMNASGFKTVGEFHDAVTGNQATPPIVPPSTESPITQPSGPGQSNEVRESVVRPSKFITEVKKYKTSEEFAKNNDFIFQGGEVGTKSEWWTTDINIAREFATRYGEGIKNDGEIRVAKFSDIPPEFRTAADEPTNTPLNKQDYQRLQAGGKGQNKIINIPNGKVGAIATLSPDAKLIDVWNQVNHQVSTSEKQIKGPDQSVIDSNAKNIVPDIVGNRNLRIATTNQIAEGLQKLLPVKEQEALTFYRDYKGNPDGLRALLSDPKLSKYEGVITQALNPTPGMLTADKVMSGYFNNALNEGKSLGFLDSSIDSDKYVTHLLTPKNEKVGKGGMFRSGSIKRTTPFAKQRTFSTVAEAIQAGIKPRSINAIDALKIYGEKHAVAASTKMGLQTLKDSGVGKFGFKDSKNIPSGWVPADTSNRFFRNTVPFVGEDGKPSYAYQDLYVPPEIAEALKPLTATDFTGQLPGFSKTRLYQSYIKSVQLGLSIFHMRALGITSLNNSGAVGTMKTILSDMSKDAFKEGELDFVKHGGISPVLGHTIEAYKGLIDTSVPSRLDVFKKATGIKAIDNFSKKLTRFTFDVVQRKFKVSDYSLKVAKFIAKNPNATEAELTDAKRSIAKEVNAAYGGLNWETLGWSKSTLNIARFLMLAPDWTFSNFFNAKYAFEGSPAGSAARKFWVRSILTGMALTYAMSTLVNKKAPKANLQNLTSVYLGKDKQGKDIYQNMFFAGAPNDAINLINNVGDYGAIAGLGLTLQNKASPFVRAGIQFLTNKNYLGQDIVPRGSGPITGTARGLYAALVSASPVPFTVSTLFQMFTDPSKQYSPQEYITALAGTRSRHVIPQGMRQVTTGSRKGQIVPATQHEQNSFWDQVTTGKLNAPKGKLGNPF